MLVPFSLSTFLLKLSAQKYGKTESSAVKGLRPRDVPSLYN